MRKYQYKLSDKETIAIYNRLAGNWTIQMVAKELGMTKQGVINAIAGIVRQWIQNGQIQLDISALLDNKSNPSN